jgi:hypothetical protein
MNAAPQHEVGTRYPQSSLNTSNSSAKAVRRGTEKLAVKRQYNLLEGQQVRLTILGSDEWSAEGRLLQVNTGLVSIESNSPIPAGVACRVDADDVLLLGECRRCEPEGLKFKAEVNLKQIIPSMSNLAKLVSAICGATPRLPNGAGARARA